jgi:hypothetical protein
VALMIPEYSPWSFSRSALIFLIVVGCVRWAPVLGALQCMTVRNKRPAWAYSLRRRSLTRYFNVQAARLVSTT